MAIHPTAIVDSQAEIDSTADIGPYVIVDGPLKIGARTRVYAHAYLTGWTEIGEDCEIHPHAVVGHLPQDLAFGGERSYCRVGAGTVIREGVTIHRGTMPDSTTVIGRQCYFMAGAHVAHNCEIGDEVKLANNVLLAGHVHVGHSAFLSGGAAVHQFVHIGELVMIGGNCSVMKDVPPYFLTGRADYCEGINVVGMRRAGFSSEQRADVQRAFRVLYRSGLLFRDAVARLASEVKTDAGQRILEFVRRESRRGIIGGPRLRHSPYSSA